jgi:hypothetical protein
MTRAAVFAGVFLALIAGSASATAATTYHVGPGHALATPSQVPWELLQPGDVVLIYWRTTPYTDKWVICREGTAAAPIVVRGVPGPAGELPVIDGDGAATRLALDYWGESRAVIKIGGASIPSDTMPRYIVIEGLDIRGARPPRTFTDDSGNTQNYSANAAAIWIEKGEHITIRGSRLHDSGNGIFVSSAEPYISRDILIEANGIFDNGNVNSLYEHNTYTEALGITYQFNYFGPTKTGALGNNLKDRSAGLVVRYNWIEGGNRQLDLVETDSTTVQVDSSYRQTFVYGNILVETEGAGNRQIVHYGGDSGVTSKYRKGHLLFYNNTLVSYRSDRTTLFRLSTNDEHADVRNNVFYVTAAGTTLSLLDSSGRLELSHNWFKPGSVNSFGALTGTIIDDGTAVVGASPGFVNEAAKDFRLAEGSTNVNAGTTQAGAVLPSNDVVSEYVPHAGSAPRTDDGAIDIGAFERGGEIEPPSISIDTTTLPSKRVNRGYRVTLVASGGQTPYTWSIAGGALPPGLQLLATGKIRGTLTTAGTFRFTVEVRDSGTPQASAMKELTIVVKP